MHLLVNNFVTHLPAISLHWLRRAMDDGVIGPIRMGYHRAASPGLGDQAGCNGWPGTVSWSRSEQGYAGSVGRPPSRNQLGSRREQSRTGTIFSPQARSSHEI